MGTLSFRQAKTDDVRTRAARFDLFRQSTIADPLDWADQCFPHREDKLNQEDEQSIRQE